MPSTPRARLYTVNRFQLPLIKNVALKYVNTDECFYMYFISKSKKRKDNNDSLKFSTVYHNCVAQNFVLCGKTDTKPDSNRQI